MNEIFSDSVEFCHKQTWFGLVLMIRRARPGIAPGMWEFGRWEKAKYYDLSRLQKSK